MQNALNQECLLATGDNTAAITETGASCDREIFEFRHSYYKNTQGQSPRLKRVSNFMLKARAKVCCQDDWQLECDVLKNGKPISQLVLARKDLLSVNSFKKALSMIGTLEFYGSIGDVTEIRGILFDQEPSTKVGLIGHGLHTVNDEWVYAEGDNVIGAEGHPDGIVVLRRNRNTVVPSNLLEQEDISGQDLADIAANLSKFNDESITFPLVGYIGYCFIKPRVSDFVSQHNPILFLQGEPGTGKSVTIQQILQPLFACINPLVNIADCTAFTAGIAASSTNMCPVFYDEWKMATVTRSQKRIMDRMILATYGQTSLERGGDGHYRYTAPMVLAGEMSNDSPSLKHRMVELFFSYSKRRGHEECFGKLVKLPLGSFGKGLLHHSLSLTDEQIHAEFAKQRTLVNPDLDDRFRDNASLLRTGLWLIGGYFEGNGLDASDYEGGLDAIDEVFKETVRLAAITTVDRVLADFADMAVLGKLVRGVDYEVKNNRLRLKIAAAYAKYDRLPARHKSAEPIGKYSFLQQVKDKPYYVGKKTMVIGGARVNGLEIDLVHVPNEVSVDSFREATPSIPEEDDDDISWQRGLDEEILRDACGFTLQTKDGKPTLTFLLYSILYSDKAMELCEILDELDRAGWRPTEKYDGRVVTMLMTKRSDLFQQEFNGWTCPVNGRKWERCRNW